MRSTPVLAAVVLVLASGVVPVTHASGAEALTRIESPAATASATKFGDVDVFEFLATGRGELIASKPELAGLVPMSPQSASREELDSGLADLQRLIPDFSRDVTRPIQSGDPYRTEEALAVYSRAIDSLATERGSTEIGTGDGRCAVVLVGAVLVAVYAAVYLWPKGASDAQAPRRLAADIALAFRV